MLEEHHLERLRGGTRFGQVSWFSQIGSTNDWLMEQARAGAHEGLVAVADYQTAGRGRRDRHWTAPAGSSLLFSVLLRPDLAPSSLHLATAAVALSAAAACAEFAGVEPAIKWPNDLLVNERKLAGVLAESIVSEGGAGPAVVVGIGLNVNWPPVLPSEVAHLATALNRESGREIDRAALLVAVLERLDDYIDDWNSVAHDYRSRCDTVGREVRVDLGAQGALEGTAVGVTPDGSLEVRDLAGRTRSVTVGDVVHLRQSEI